MRDSAVSQCLRSHATAEAPDEPHRRITLLEDRGNRGGFEKGEESSNSNVRAARQRSESGLRSFTTAEAPDELRRRIALLKDRGGRGGLSREV